LTAAQCTAAALSAPSWRRATWPAATQQFFGIEIHLGQQEHVVLLVQQLGHDRLPSRFVHLAELQASLGEVSLEDREPTIALRAA
jgi:hypothetical protein